MAELPIGQVSRRVGVSARRLRHWDQVGLFTPTKVSGNGYRCYDESQLPHLCRFITLRRNGLGLDELGLPSAGHSRIGLTECAEHLGGTLTAASTSTGGFAVELTIPA